MTDYKNIGRIDLLPNAFLNEEQLVRTLIHEKCHVMQLKNMVRDMRKIIFKKWKHKHIALKIFGIQDL